MNRCYKQKALEILNKRIEALKEQKKALDWLDTLTPIFDAGTWSDGSIDSSGTGVWLTFPLDKILRNEHRRALADDGWEIKDYLGGITSDYYNKGVNSINLSYEDNRPGSTCKLVKIGTKDVTYTRQVYEVVCNEVIAMEEAERRAKEAAEAAALAVEITEDQIIDREAEED